MGAEAALLNIILNDDEKQKIEMPTRQEYDNIIINIRYGKTRNKNDFCSLHKAIATKISLTANCWPLTVTEKELDYYFNSLKNELFLRLKDENRK